MSTSITAKRVARHMALDRERINQQLADAEAARKQHRAEHDDAAADLAELVVAIHAAADHDRPVLDDVRQDVNSAHAAMQRADTQTLAAVDLAVSLREQRAALDDPDEKARRIAEADGAGAGRKADAETVSGREAALIVLRQSGSPMHYRDIVRIALDAGLIVTKGRTPEATMNAVLCKSMQSEDTPFEKVGPGVFGLKVKPDGAQKVLAAAAAKVRKRPARRAAKS